MYYDVYMNINYCTLIDFFTDTDVDTNISNYTGTLNITRGK